VGGGYFNKLAPAATTRHRRLLQQNLPKADICTAAILPLFDHLVGTAEQR
jgi:hypothetical protein